MKSKQKAANVREFPQIRRLSPEEKAYLVMLFIEHDDSIELVKEQFERTARRKISFDAIEAVRREHNEQIERRRQELAGELEHIRGSKISDRLRQLRWIYREARKVRTRYSIKLDRDTYDTYDGPDLKMCLAATMAQERVMMNARKLAILYSRTLSGSIEDFEEEDDPEPEFDDDEAEYA